MSEFRGREFKIIIAVLLLSGSFLFFGRVKNSDAALLNSYSKLYNGTLTAQEWNNLASDFAKTFGPVTMTGPLSIGTTTIPGSGLLVDGPIIASNFSGLLTGGLDAANVMGGNGSSFGSNFGGGNYSFPNNVGIGTTTPLFKFQVQGSVDSQTALFSNPTGKTKVVIKSGATNTGSGTYDKILTVQDVNGAEVWGVRNDGMMFLHSFYGVDNTISINDGTIGGSTGTGLSMNSNGGVRWSNNTGAFWVTDSGLTRLGSSKLAIGNGVVGDYSGSLIASSIGIGVTNPGAKLDVLGSLRASSATISNVNSGVVMADASGNLYATSSAAATGIPIGGNGQTLRSDGTSWLANSLLFNNGTNIGIGTTSPGAKLDVAGLIRANNNAQGEYVFKSGAANAYVGLIVTRVNEGTNSDWEMGVAGAAGHFSSTSAQGDIINRYYGGNYLFSNGANERMRITQAGNVGIGITSPTNKLHIAQSDSALANSALLISDTQSGENNRLYIGSNTDGAYYRTDYTTGGDLSHRFFTYNTEVMRISGNGNVGIGTTNPGTTLDVGGAIASFRAKSATLSNIGSGVIMADASGNLYSTSTAAATGIPSPAGLSGQTLRSNGTSWIANNLLFNDGTNVGIGTTTLTAKLGIQGSGADILNLFDSAGAEKVSVLNNGNVGIGTTNPQLKLSVQGTAAAATGNTSGIARFRNDLITSGMAPEYVFSITRQNSDVAAWYLGNDGNNNSVLSTNNGNFRLGHDISSIFYDDITILGNGVFGSANVGIGTTNPGTTLDIGGAIASFRANSATLSNIGSGVIMADASGNLYSTSTAAATGIPSPSGLSGQTLRSNGTSWIANNLLFNDGTNVGIGTTTLTAKLGIQGSGADILNLFDSAGAEKVSVLNNGNVGIGTTNPTYKLHVAGDMQVDTTGGASFRVNTNGGLNFYSYLQPFIFQSNYAGPGLFSFRFGNTDRMTILQNGNVGIGTTNPGTTLDIGGAIASFRAKSATLSNIGSGVIMADASGNLYSTSTAAATGIPSPSGLSGQTLRSNGTSWIANNLLFNDGTNVGIGTSTLVAKLGIQGSGADILNLFDSAGAEKVSVLNNGNVGIGTTNPGATLTLKGNFSVEGIATTSNAILSYATPYYGRLNYSVTPVNGKSEVRFVSKGATAGAGQTYFVIASTEAADTGNNLLMGVANNRAFIANAVNYATGGVLHLGGTSWEGDGVVQISGLPTDATGKVTIMGNVGIGTTTPGTTLDVGGAIASFRAKSATLSNIGSGVIMADASGNLYSTSTVAATGIPSPSGLSGQTLRSDGTNWIANNLIYNNGTNVGVGTTNPTAKLHINGPAAGSGPNLNINGDMILGSGTGASIFFDGNYSYASGNYIRAVATNTQAFFTAGAERLRITSAGNVGIGTTNPGYKLDVRSTNYGYQTNIETSQAENWNRLAASSGSGEYGISGDKLYFQAMSTLQGIYFSNEAFNAGLFIKQADGNVGIGTTAPGATLDVGGAIASFRAKSATLSNIGSGVIMADASGNLYSTSTAAATGIPSPSGLNGQTLRSNGTSWIANNLLFNDGTNVGVGTTSATYKLDIDGSFGAISNSSSIILDASGNISIGI